MKKIQVMFMKKEIRKKAGMMALPAVAAAALLIQFSPLAAEAAEEKDYQAAYCLYSSEDGQYFYTVDQNEKDYLKENGWEYKGIGWYAPVSSGTPVYRLYNPENNSHHFTSSAIRRDYLIREGWTDEGIGWYSGEDQEVAVYHQYSSDQEGDSCKYAVIEAENDEASESEWRTGELAWYGVEIDPEQLAADREEAEEEICRDQEEKKDQQASANDADVDLTGAKDLGDFYLTAYYNPWGNPTASGAPTVANHTIAQNSLPFGSRVYIEGLGVYTVEDRGAVSNGSHWIDVYCNTLQDCYNLPVRNARVYLLP